MSNDLKVTFREETIIARPPADVFAFLEDQSRVSQWSPNIDDCRLTRGRKTRIGSQRVQFLKMFGRKFSRIFHCTAHRAGSFLQWSTIPGTSKFPVVDSYYLAEILGQTLVVHVVDIRPRGRLMGILKSFMIKRVQKSMRLDLAALSEMIEAQPPAAMAIQSKAADGIGLAIAA